MADERNTIVVAHIDGEQADTSRVAKLSRQVLKQFTKEDETYRFKDVPSVVAFTDYGDRLATDLDNPEVATAMTKLAESKGWTDYMVKGSVPFYDAVEKRSNEASEEIQQLKQSEPEKDALAFAFTDNPDTITVKMLEAGDPDEKRCAVLSGEVLERFKQDNDTYRFKDAPESVVFTDNGDSISSDLDEAEVVAAMIKLAEAKGWSYAVTKGNEPYYDVAAKRTAEQPELSSVTSATTEKTAPDTEAVKVDKEPVPVTATNLDESTSTQQQAQKAKQIVNEAAKSTLTNGGEKFDDPRLNAVILDKIDEAADEKVVQQRQALAQAVYEQYRVAGFKYYFKDQAGSVGQLAFKDTDTKLTTALNSERVTRSLVDLTEAKGWTDIKVSGHKEFRRQVWRAATERGIEVSGYKPDDKDLAVVSDKALKNVIEPVPTQDKRLSATLYNQSGALTESRVAAAVASHSKGSAKTPSVTGVLVKHGSAPYKHQRDNKGSYYVTVDTEKGERTVWGVDLASAVTEADVKTGEKVLLRHTGAEPVTVKDKSGKWVNSMRNAWTVERTDKREVITAVAAAMAAKHVHNPEDRRRIADGIQARMDEHRGPLPQVQVYDNSAASTTNIEQEKFRTKAPELIR